MCVNCTRPYGFVQNHRRGRWFVPFNLRLLRALKANPTDAVGGLFISFSLMPATAQIVLGVNNPPTALVEFRMSFRSPIGRVSKDHRLRRWDSLFAQSSALHYAAFTLRYMSSQGPFAFSRVSQRFDAFSQFSRSRLKAPCFFVLAAALITSLRVRG
jgi:hypothetical protein